MTTLVLIGLGLLALVLLAIGAYAFRRYYVARTDRTYMTHNEDGFKRALHGRGVLWDYEEAIVKGPEAPKLEYVAFDPATGQRRAGQLIDSRTGSINLRPQYCVPLPFAATTADGHRLIVEARVQFSINRDLLKYVYQLDDFSLALETRIHSAFRAEIGRRQDEVLRGSLHDVENAVIAHLRKAEADGDEVGEAGLALGVNFHTASFTYAEAEDHFAALASGMIPAPTVAGATAETTHAAAATTAQAHGAVRTVSRAQGVLSLRPQQLDQLADAFKGREPASTAALLAMLEMQTRQNIAEALASSGQLVVVTSQELGLTGASAQRDAVERGAGGARPV
ncbi:MAG: hypothetical protein IV086_02760 [Hyphomonadaceae bacterium]|nr:MAG: hypothetical protein FD160_2655 [Caulobacteraceae bacterium]MBT9444603.1 hypothetical protein [Hyphomonadaceae bacterium]TPW04514.1 MAG: hypothetical protein FD124_2587 [Alphaproteobacteria bacterium]